jgi:hypothetical protein
MPHVHNALHHLTQVQAGYRAALGEDGADFTGIERAGETMTPVLDLWSRPEFELLRGEVLYRRAENSPAVAARLSVFELVNPAGSGILAVVTNIENDGATPELEISPDSGVAVGLNPATSRGVAVDTRWPNLGEVSRCALVGGDTAAGAAIRVERIAGSSESSKPYILRPGTKLFIAGLTVNTAISLGISWRERLASPAELGVIA